MKLTLIKKQIGGLAFYEPSCENSRLILQLMGRGRKCFTRRELQKMIAGGWKIEGF